MNERVYRHIVRRDFPDGVEPTCLFCGRALRVRDDGGGPVSARKKAVVDHLDGNRRNHSCENLAFVHQECKRRKRKNDRYRILAYEKPAKNRECARLSHRRAPEQRGNIKVGHTLYRHAKEYLMDNLPDADAPAIPLQAACYELAYLAQEKYGYGSALAMKRHLETLCAGIAPWEITYETGEPVITRRHSAVIEMVRAAREAKRRRRQGRRNPRGPAQTAGAPRRNPRGPGGTSQRRPKAPRRGHPRRNAGPLAP